MSNNRNSRKSKIKSATSPIVSPVSPVSPTSSSSSFPVPSIPMSTIHHAALSYLSGNVGLQSNGINDTELVFEDCYGNQTIRLDIGSFYEPKTQGYLSLKTMRFVKTWDDIVFLYSVQESLSLSTPKYSIKNNRTDVFSSPKGAFFDQLLPSFDPSNQVGSSTSSSSSSTSGSSLEPSGIILRKSDGTQHEVRVSQNDYMRSLSIKTAMDKEETVTLKVKSPLLLVDFAFFSIGQKAYYAPKNFGIFLLYDFTHQRMLWLKTYLDFNQLFAFVC